MLHCRFSYITLFKIINFNNIFQLNVQVSEGLMIFRDNLEHYSDFPQVLNFQFLKSLCNQFCFPWACPLYVVLFC